MKLSDIFAPVIILHAGSISTAVVLALAGSISTAVVLALAVLLLASS